MADTQTDTYERASLGDALLQVFAGAVERQAATKQDKEDNSSPPHVHRPAVELAPYQLRCLVVGCADPTCRQSNSVSYIIPALQLQWVSYTTVTTPVPAGLTKGLRLPPSSVVILK